MELNIQKFLRSNPDGLAVLAAPPYSLNIKRHSKYNNLVQFTYDQLDSPKADPIIVESRGLILNEADNWNVIAFPFVRFFNQGEFYAADIDWKTARVQEKVDGTLIIMYFYDNKWQIATRGSPDASGPVGDFPWNENGLKVPLIFERLFWHSAEYWLKGLSKSGYFKTDYTYMWELTSPYNRVVCDYTELGPIGQCTDGFENTVYLDDLVDQTGYGHDGSRITLIGIRSNLNFQEIPVSLLNDDVHYVVKEFPLQNLNEILEAAAKLNPLRQEGFVVVDNNFNRIKIKSPAYVAIHHLRDGSPRRRLMDIIKNGESDELMAYNILDDFPSEKAMYLEMKDQIENIILQTEQGYDRIKDIESQKEFALEALKYPMHFAMFAARKGKRDRDTKLPRTIREVILTCPTDKLLDMIDGKKL